LGGLGNRSLNIELEDRFFATLELAHSPPPWFTRAGSAVTNRSVAFLINGSIVTERWPVIFKVF